MARILEPLVNGHRYSFASIEVEIAGLRIAAVRAISYSSELAPGSVYGTDPGRVGRTPGKATHAAEVELLRREWDELRQALTGGDELASFGRIVFDVHVQYAEQGEAVMTDRLVDCRITKVDHPNTDSTDATAVRLTLDPWDILYGGHSIEDRLALVYPFPVE